MGEGKAKRKVNGKWVCRCPRRCSTNNDRPGGGFQGANNETHDSWRHAKQGSSTLGASIARLGIV